MFSIGWEVIGLSLELNRVRIISKQPFFQGVAPTLSEIEGFMRSCGFESNEHRFGAYWKHVEQGVVAFDAEPGNFVKTPFGLVPIDIILQKESSSDESSEPSSSAQDPKFKEKMDKGLITAHRPVIGKHFSIKTRLTYSIKKMI